MICVICHLSLPSPVRVLNKKIKTSTLLSLHLSLPSSHTPFMYTRKFICMCRSVCVYILCTYTCICYAIILWYQNSELFCLYFSILYISKYFLHRRASIKIEDNLVQRGSEGENHCRQLSHGMESRCFKKVFFLRRTEGFPIIHISGFWWKEIGTSLELIITMCQMLGEH